MTKQKTKWKDHATEGMSVNNMKYEMSSASLMILYYTWTHFKVGECLVFIRETPSTKTAIWLGIYLADVLH